MQVGDRVRVKKSVIVYHHPQHRKKRFDLQGQEGEIVEIIDSLISATLPIKVQFEKRFAAHLTEDEIELI